MRKIRKALTSILIITFLCQNMAFCLPEKGATLRLPVNGSRRVKEAIDVSQPKPASTEVVKDVEEKTFYSPEPHHNLLQEDSFDLVLQDGRKVNFIQMWREALDKIYGSNNWILCIGGSLVHLAEGKGLFWEGAYDIDVKIFKMSDPKEVSFYGVLNKVSSSKGLPIDVDPILSRDNYDFFVKIGDDKINLDITVDDLDMLVAPRRVYPYNLSAYNPFEYYADSDNSLVSLNKAISAISLEDLSETVLATYKGKYANFLSTLEKRGMYHKPMNIATALVQLSAMRGKDKMRLQIVRKLKAMLDNAKQAGQGGSVEQQLRETFLMYKDEFDPDLIGDGQLLEEILGNLYNRSRILLQRNGGVNTNL